MSHWYCKRCSQWYDGCFCFDREVASGILPKESSIKESEEEKEMRFEKFYEEVKALCLKYEIKVKI